MNTVKTFEEFINESQEEILWQDDFYSEKKSIRKKSPAKSSNAVTIEAAKNVAKRYKIKFQDILKDQTPDNNIAGEKTWDKLGNITK
jgi:hypothetical protein